MSRYNTPALARLAKCDPEDVAAISGVSCLCVASTQRSGSTMVARDLTAADRFGKVEEHVKGVQSALKTDGPPDSIASWIARGQLEPGGTFGLKVMVSQLPVLGAWITPSAEAVEILRQDRPVMIDTFSKAAIAWLRQARHLHVLRLERGDVFAQAYSRIRARQSGLYHRLAGGKTMGPRAATEFTPADLDVAEIALEIGALLEERADLERLFPEDAADVSPLRYEDIVEQGIDVAGQAAAAMGLTMREDPAGRKRTSKIVSGDELAEAKSIFARALHLDIAT